MFCPNCGAQNQDTATACAKCGFALKAAAATAPKFKGTMLMMNAPPAAVPRPGAPPAGAQAAPPAATPAPGTAAPSIPAAPAIPAATRPKLKGTMIGVAPPSMGSNTGPLGAPQAPAPAAAPPAFAPPAYQPPAPAAAPPAPAHEPPSAVNPLGGTVVADTSSFGAMPKPPQGMGGAPYDAPPGFGAPPPGFGGQQPGYSAPTAAFGSPPSGFGAQAPADAPPKASLTR